MSTQGGQYTGAAKQVKANAAGRMEVRWGWPLPGGVTHAGRTRRTRGIALALVLVCLLALPPLAPVEAVPPPAPALAPDAPGDEYWAAGFNPPGMNGPVTALAVGLDDSLYAGGIFTTADGKAANYIARWDGSQWHPLGSGMTGGEYAYVYALAVGLDGALYAGGYFTTAGGIAANNIARWDGSQWHPLGSGTGCCVSALTIGPDGSLYAGGGFHAAGGVAANYIARWDGTQWHPLGSGMGGVANPAVLALAFGPDGSLYAGGRFATAGGVEVNRIARWDGSQWHPLGSGMTGADYPEVLALAFGPDGSLYAGGGFTTAGGVPANYIARWDGSQWHPLGSGIGGNPAPPYYSWVRALAFGPDGSLYAGGNFTTAGGVTVANIARWDGSQWRPLGSGIRSAVFALVYGPDGSLYAGGGSNVAGGVSTRGIARWDGVAWRPVSPGSGMSGSVLALAFGPDGSLYAGGWFTAAGTTIASHIARWDGSQWHPLGSGMDWHVYTLAVGLDGSLYAGGGFTTAGGVAVNRIARWDLATSSWQSLGTGMNGSVSALAIGPDGSLYAGGWFTTAGGVAANNIARWDGAQWYPLGSGMDNRVHALAVGLDGALYAGGRFATAGGVPANYIARWDGSQWHPLGSGMTGGEYPYVNALAVGPDGSLYAGGRFATAGGVPANYIARWDGSQWHPLGSGIGGNPAPPSYSSVRALAFGPDGSLYAGGSFTTAGGVPANYIARWDGSQWHPLGSGMTGADYPEVLALAFGTDGSLYAGGEFDAAGDKPSSYIAQWLKIVNMPPVFWFPLVRIHQ